MALINTPFLKVVNDEIQNKIDKKVNQFQAINRDKKLINLSSGDVIRPLAPCVMEAMHKAIAEMGDETTFQGRGPVEGYPFLIDAILKYNFKNYKIKIAPDEVFINHGTKENLAGFGDILCRDNRIAVIDPVSQEYIESNVIGNRAGDLNENLQWSHIVYLECKKENDFMPEFPKLRPDIIYMSYPNNPTGCVMTREILEKWVQYALKNDILILFDATYKSFVTNPEIPQTIYEIKDAKKVAIEFRSFSKNAGFTGLNCGYAIIPKTLSGYSYIADKGANLNALWRRRLMIKNYTPPYIIQRGAEALFSQAGLKWVRENVDYYMSNAAILRQALTDAGLKFWGGVNSPYIWVESPYDSSWKLFDKLLNDCYILSSPGERFGPHGRGFVRLSSFANQSKVIMAGTRIASMK
ncbi:MAG: LL-diaminopimelate aminotransferase [Bacteroidales bacterium]|jgi:LL-diaminopimelate aminotransferase|nr:LL-diaminopimelate aminotransferase [Bacteroidales bacterium]